MPVKQNMPIWSVMWLQSFVDPSFFRPSFSIALIEMILRKSSDILAHTDWDKAKESNGFNFE